jgi:hypothetical protein
LAREDDDFGGAFECWLIDRQLEFTAVEDSDQLAHGDPNADLCCAHAKPNGRVRDADQTGILRDRSCPPVGVV